MIARMRKFEDGASLAHGLAQDVAGWLKAAIATQGAAVLAVSGGSTPKPFFDALSRLPLEWAKVTITLVDERCVPEDNPRSNARLLRDQLWRNEAAAAQFVPLYLNPMIGKLAPLDVVILGMGNDGHTASFFPGGNNLAKALDFATREAVLPMEAPGAGEPRLTFSLAKLRAAKNLCLHTQGADKMQVLEKALAGQDQFEMPVRAVLHSDKPLDVYWCP
ncbi:MAG: 6-phosphogluconolactonase [Alphaproteobacteria bacterium]|nr:6-phosphogluconolactonase [Alphaproteobacteria bacterium]